VPREQIQLLPFEVRLARVATVAGVDLMDPILADLRNNHIDLGDYDYANGVKPDGTWNATRIGLWVKSLRAVCDSAAMKRKYPALPANLGDLVFAAYGRSADDDDRLAASEAANASFDDATRYRLVCLAMLSAVEFVAR
jgi:hypothetical protein